MRKTLKMFFIVFILSNHSYALNDGKKIFIDPIKSHAIYGEDGRRQYYEMNDNPLQSHASSSVALIHKKNISYHSQSGFFILNGSTFGEQQNLCPNEPFINEKSIADCSGVLIDKDIVLTAAHCLTNQKECEDYKVVFDFKFDQDEIYSNQKSPYQISKDNLYSCQKILKRKYKYPGQDMLILKLDRPVINRVPAIIPNQESVEAGDTVFSIGYPYGIPLKFSLDGHVRKVYKRYFVASLDVYAANSGSPIYSQSTGELLGILSSGEKDFIDPSQKHPKKNKPPGLCRKSKVCEEDACEGENIIKIQEVFSLFI